MIDQVDINYIKENLEFWNSLTLQEKQTIINNAYIVKYEKGKIIYDGIDGCTGLMIVKKGQLRNYILSESGKEVTMYRLFDGDICIMSASCILKNITFHINVQAEKEIEIIIIPKEIYNHLSQNSVEIQRFTNNLISSRFSDVMWIIDQILFMSFDKRLAMFLKEQSVIENSNTLTFTHEDIAKDLGSAREVVTRMLKYFQNENIVKLSRKSITIIDEKKLNELIT